MSQFSNITFDGKAVSRMLINGKQCFPLEKISHFPVYVYAKGTTTIHANQSSSFNFESGEGSIIANFTQGDPYELTFELATAGNSSVTLLDNLGNLGNISVIGSGKYFTITLPETDIYYGELTITISDTDKYKTSVIKLLINAEFNN